MANDISLCPNCFCMTHKVCGKCGFDARKERWKQIIKIGCQRLIDNSEVRSAVLDCSQDGYESGVEDVLNNLYKLLK